jgi:hypothetical protein
MDVANHVGRVLARLGVECVFGVVGSGNFHVTNALVAAGAKFVAARHECGAAVMADAWARTTENVGVVTVHQGPGLTNAMTGIAEAAKSRTPLLVLAAEAPEIRSNFHVDVAGLAAAVGAVGAILLAAFKRTLGRALGEVIQRTAQVTCMIFVILIGATMFSLVFRGLGGDDMVTRTLANLPGGAAGAILVVMLAMFLLGFVMDAFEIIFVVVPIVAVPLMKLHAIDPIWLGIMMAMNLQTSYMHPPLGPTLFFLRGVAPPEITTRHIYLGIIPYVAIQLFALVVLWSAPGLATALPHALYGGR